MEIVQYHIILVDLGTGDGSEIKKIRPCVVVSPDEMNRNIRTVLIAPMTTANKGYPTRVSCTFRKKHGQIALDQIRTIDKARLVKKLGTIDSNAQLEVISVLQRLFAF